MQQCMTCGYVVQHDLEGLKTKNSEQVMSSGNILDRWFCSECLINESDDEKELESPLRILWALS